METQRGSRSMMIEWMKESGSIYTVESPAESLEKDRAIIIMQIGLRPLSQKVNLKKKA